MYAFPPNIGASYPPPGGPPGVVRKPISVSSYLPPPSGPTNYPIYPGPLAPKPDPPFNPQRDNMQENPAPAMDDGNDNTNMDDSGPDRPSDAMQQIIDKPPSDFLPGKRPEGPPLPFLDHEHDHSHDHDHHFDERPPFIPYSDDSLKHLHGIEVYPGTLLVSTCLSLIVICLSKLFFTPSKKNNELFEQKRGHSALPN